MVWCGVLGCVTFMVGRSVSYSVTAPEQELIATRTTTTTIVAQHNRTRRLPINNATNSEECAQYYRTVDVIYV